MSGQPTGFRYERKGDDVLITHQGRKAATLRGTSARRFLAEVADGDPQELMARVTGNYKHGNERTAKHHPRHQRR